MKKLFFAMSVLICGSLIMLSAQDKTATPAAKDGKTIFAAAKCALCHPIKSQEITTKKEKPAIDLSDVGTKLKAPFIIKWLKKDETIDGKKHPIPFKGDDGDLAILAKWLESLKIAPAAPKK